MDIKWFGDAIVASVNAVIGAEVGSVAENVAEDAREFVPEGDTLTLYDSIKVVKDIKKEGGMVRLAYVTAGERVAGGGQFLSPGRDRTKAGAFYAGFVEFGTWKMGKSPFLRPAIRKNKKSGMDALNTAFRNAIR